MNLSSNVFPVATRCSRVPLQSPTSCRSVSAEGVPPWSPIWPNRRALARDRSVLSWGCSFWGLWVLGLTKDVALSKSCRKSSQVGPLSDWLPHGVQEFTNWLGLRLMSPIARRAKRPSPDNACWTQDFQPSARSETNDKKFYDGQAKLALFFGGIQSFQKSFMKEYAFNHIGILTVVCSIPRN